MLLKQSNLISLQKKKFPLENILRRLFNRFIIIELFMMDMCMSYACDAGSNKLQNKQKVRKKICHTIVSPPN